MIQKQWNIDNAETIMVDIQTTADFINARRDPCAVNKLEDAAIWDNPAAFKKKFGWWPSCPNHKPLTN